MKLHLGCGPKEFVGWYHVDALDYPHVDHIGPVEKLDFIADQSVEMIYACHVLEHFGRNAYKDVLREWCRVLQPGGVLQLAVPDFAACAEAYVGGELRRGLLDVTGLLMGGQRDKYDYHAALFDKPTLTSDLIECGFSTVREWNWRDTDHSDIDDYSQSYLPHMEKDTGRLMSLNLEGVR